MAEPIDELSASWSIPPIVSVRRPATLLSGGLQMTRFFAPAVCLLIFAFNFSVRSVAANKVLDRKPLANGARAYALFSSNGVAIPSWVERDLMVDIVFEESEPIKTATSIQNVRVLEVEFGNLGRDAAVFELSPTQCEVVTVLADKPKLKIVLRQKEKPKK